MSFLAGKPRYNLFWYGYCFVGDPRHKIVFANSSFNDNIGGDHGAAIHIYSKFILDIPQYQYVNTINDCIFCNNVGYTSLIYSSSYDTAVHLIVKDSTFMNDRETVS